MPSTREEPVRWTGSLDSRKFSVARMGRRQTVAGSVNNESK